MKIENLKEGMIIKNYKELCELLEIKYTTGGAKQNQLIELKTWCKYHKEGKKFIIDEIYDKQKSIKKKSISKNYRQIDSFCINMDIMNHSGIYYIIENNNIYIGSTIVSFRERFRSHYGKYNKNKDTYMMLHNQGEFHLLHDMTGIEDEPLIRQVEKEYINYFRKNSNLNVINDVEPVSCIKRKDKIKFVNFKINKNNLEEVLDYCESNNIEYKLSKTYK